MPTKRRQSIERYSVKKTTVNTLQQKNIFQFLQSVDIKILIAVFLLCIFLLWLITDTVAFAGKCYVGVKIDNVDVSGLNATQAKQKLQEIHDKNLYEKTIYIFTEEYAFEQVNLQDYFSQQDKIAEQISSLEEASETHIYQSNATDVGASYAYDDAIKEALEPGHDLNIFSRINLRMFGCEFDLRLEMGDGIDSLYSKVAQETGEPHTDYGIKVSNGEVSITTGAVGKTVNREKFSEGIASALMQNTTEPQKVLFNIEEDPIVIDEAKANEAKQRAEMIIEDGALFEFDGTQTSATKTNLGDWITTWVNTQTNALEIDFDNNKAKQGISKLIEDSHDNSNVDVSIQKQDSGEIVINPTSDVSVPDLQNAVDKLKEIKLRDEENDEVIEIDSSEQKNNFDFNTALEVGLITQISSYTTKFTNTASTANRNHNIALVSDAISNTIVSANDSEFSYNTAAGPTDAEHGYLEAGTQVGGQTVQETGGGICQVATTVFNAAYEAGFPITERHNHSLRNLSYPAGRDAAVYVSDDGSYEQDLKWENDTSSDVLVKSWHDDTSVTVAIYGVSPNRNVETISGDFEEGEKHNIVFEEDDTLAQGQYNIKTVGADGTQIEVERIVYDKSGNLLYDDNFNSVYAKIDEEISVGPGTDTEKIRESRS